MKEEEKQSTVHYDMAKKIVNTLATKRSQVIQQRALVEVLKPLLKKQISETKQKNTHYQNGGSQRRK
jgi:hypothetical protein